LVIVQLFCISVLSRPRRASSAADSGLAFKFKCCPAKSAYRHERASGWDRVLAA
jgi:hypothetical protein